MNEMWVWCLFYHQFTMCILLTKCFMISYSFTKSLFKSTVKCAVAENYPRKKKRNVFYCTSFSFIITLGFNLMQNFFSSSFLLYIFHNLGLMTGNPFTWGVVECSFYFNLIMIMVFIYLLREKSMNEYIFMHQVIFSPFSFFSIRIYINFSGFASSIFPLLITSLPFFPPLSRAHYIIKQPHNEWEILQQQKKNYEKKKKIY